MNQWNKFDESIEKDIHGDFRFYRDLYHGEHSTHSERAIALKEKGEIIDQTTGGTVHAKNVQVPYIMANLSKIIPEIPATFVSRSIGQVKTSYEDERASEENDPVSQNASDMIDGPEEGAAVNTDVAKLQQELLDQITKNSQLTVDEHWTNILHHQVDGGIVGVPFIDEDGIRLEFKGREIYYPHANGKGADLIYTVNRENEDGEKENYIRIYTEYVKDGNLYYENQLKRLDAAGNADLIEDEAEVKEVLEFGPDDSLSGVHIGRSRPFIEYWANERTFKYPLGVSCLKGQWGKQDEINWTLTRNAITFERNGKPRIIVSEAVMARLQEIATDKRGDPSMIDAKEMEISTFDENGRGLEIVQLDVSKIGTFENVKNYMKLMLMETQTSEKAVDFYMGEAGGGAAISGVAKYYDLLISILKAERIQDGYIGFLKRLYESALWLAHKQSEDVIIEQPQIELKEMIPVSRKEESDENIAAFEKEAQSLETTIRNRYPEWSDDKVDAELERIREDSESINSSSLMGMGTNISSLLDNPLQRPSQTATQATQETLETSEV